jgi:hypothetical protein
MTEKVEIELRPNGAQVIRLICGIELEMIIKGEQWHLQAKPKKANK